MIDVKISPGELMDKITILRNDDIMAIIQKMLDFV